MSIKNPLSAYSFIILITSFIITAIILFLHNPNIDFCSFNARQKIFLSTHTNEQLTILIFFNTDVSTILLSLTSRQLFFIYNTFFYNYLQSLKLQNILTGYFFLYFCINWSFLPSKNIPMYKISRFHTPIPVFRHTFP